MWKKRHKDCLTVKADKASINVSNFSYKSYKLLRYAKKQQYLHETSILNFTKNLFSQVQLIWAPKLVVPKNGTPLTKRT